MIGPGYTMEESVTIRPFDGSLADAEGLLGVERATFDESPYNAADVQAMLRAGPQQAWLAVQGERVAGFAIAFLVAGVRGSWWEVDLLAVHPDWRGLRLGRQLIEATTAYGGGVARQARAVVADDNYASTNAFQRAGFQIVPGVRHLLIHRTREETPRPGAWWGGRVREAAAPEEVADYLAGLSAAGPEAVPPPGPEAAGSIGMPGSGGASLLLAEESDLPGEWKVRGHAELIEVQTLLYRGIWIESVLASTQVAREALVGHVVRRASEAGLDEIGTLVHESDRAMERVLLSAGFRSLGRFQWLVAPLSGG
jgi:ribosomal protein S18 acetylase RimI-like enzyme